jgi:hypothetical protein
MKKLILSILLFTVINCSGQYKCVYQDTAAMLKPYKKDTLGVRPIIDNRLNLFYKTPESAQALTISQKRIYIDSTYLQLIIQELERHGYELPKIKNKQPIEYEWITFNAYAPSVKKTNKGDFVITTDSLTAIKQLWNEIERREKEHEQITNKLYKLLKTNK